MKTYGDNLVGVGTRDNTQVSNVLFEDFYYGSIQQEIFCSTALDPSKYVGAVVELPGSTGDLSFKNLTVDKVKTIVSGDVAVDVEGFACTCARTLNENGKLTIDGKEICHD